MLEGFKVAQTRGLSHNRFIIAIILVTIVGTISSAWAYFAQGYHYGAAVYGEQAQCRWTYEQLKQWLINPQSIDVGAVSASGGAIALTTFLMILRRRFIWWPLPSCRLRLVPEFLEYELVLVLNLFVVGDKSDSLSDGRTPYLSSRDAVFYRFSHWRVSARRHLDLNRHRLRTSHVPIHVLNFTLRFGEVGWKSSRPFP